MKMLTILGGVAWLSVVLATGTFAEMKGGEPGTSKNPEDNVPEEIQRSTPSGGLDASQGDSGSGPGTRSDELSGMKHEKAVKEGHAELEKNVEETHGGSAAAAAEELQEEGMKKSHKGISAETDSSKKMKKKAMKKKAE
jgi:hypothetical protein